MIDEQAYFRFNDGDFIGRPAIRAIFEKTWRGDPSIKKACFHLTDIVVLTTDDTTATATYTYNWEGSQGEGVSTLNTSAQAARRFPIMQTTIPEVTAETLQAFADAWNRHDVDALMSFMTEDCVFESSAGADVCGTRYVGSAAVRAGFAETWAVFPDAHWGNARHLVHGDQGVSEWTFTGTRADGTRVEVHGCDLFTFRDGKIFLKNSYRKNRPPLAKSTR